MSATEDGFRTCLGFRVLLIWHVSSPIGQSAIYVQNLNVNTQIVKVPLQALFSLVPPPPSYSKANLRITRTESMFAGYEAQKG